jgi:hypothetical protein
MGRQKQKSSIEISREEALDLHNLVKDSRLGIQLKKLINDLQSFEGESQVTLINKNLSQLNRRMDEHGEIKG